MKDAYVWIAVAVIALVTALLRFLPFAVFSGKRRVPAVIERLGKVLPCAIMGMLVVYCLKDTTFTSLGGFLPALISCLAVAGLHIWKRNTLISIVAGTVCYMVLVQGVFG
jgi:branched-subunit amino acid transport protein AzlD